MKNTSIPVTTRPENTRREQTVTNEEIPVREDLRRRATQPFRGSPEYLRAVKQAAEAVARNGPPPPPRSAIRLSSFEWDARLVATVMASLIALGTILWAGCRVVSSLPATLGERDRAIKLEAAN
jgi:hypothetical protein